MEMISSNPEIVKTILIGIVLFLIGTQFAVGQNKNIVLMGICFFGTLVCVLVAWFNMMGAV